jgi:hypothetical protein
MGVSRLPSSAIAAAVAIVGVGAVIGLGALFGTWIVGRAPVPIAWDVGPIGSPRERTNPNRMKAQQERWRHC